MSQLPVEEDDSAVENFTKDALRDIPEDSIPQGCRWCGQMPEHDIERRSPGKVGGARPPPLYKVGDVASEIRGGHQRIVENIDIFVG